jgi:hypothetical protein
VSLFHHFINSVLDLLVHSMHKKPLMLACEELRVLLSSEPLLKGDLRGESTLNYFKLTGVGIRAAFPLSAGQSY